MSKTCRQPCGKEMWAANVDHNPSLIVIRWLCASGHTLHEHINMKPAEREVDDKWAKHVYPMLAPAKRYCKVCGAELDATRNATAMYCDSTRPCRRTAERAQAEVRRARYAKRKVAMG